MDTHQEENVHKLVAHLFREEAGKMTSLLTRIFGLHQIEIAEDIVQETLIAALNQWSVGEIPDNPSGWLLQVAKYKTINFLKREDRIKSYGESELDLYASSPGLVEAVFNEEETSDSQLRMIFACCHPALPKESQIALTLKTLCGFSVSEIAHALLTTDANVNKRLYRAKQKFRKKQITLVLPATQQLDERLDSVYLNLYLLFNEGYNSSHYEKLIREDLCFEAIRLLTLLTTHIKDEPKSYALLALMYMHAARFNARLDQKGGIIIFKDQDRNLWDKEMIQSGLSYLEKAASGDALSEYHLEAGIAAEHCLAENYATTNWQNLYYYYKQLYTVKQNPIIELNMAIISSKIDGVAASIKKLVAIEASARLHNYYLLSATLGTFYFELGNKERAKIYFQKALDQTRSKTEKDFLTQFMARCE